MAQYYYAASGNDSTGTGTISLPWATLSHALANSIAGDTISGNGGDTISDNPSATSGRNLNSYGTGQVTIAGGSSADTFLSTNAAGWNISNMIFTNTDSTNTFRCVDFLFNDGNTYHAGITVNGCTVTGSNIGLTVRTTNAAGFISGILFENCVVSGCADQGISTSATAVASNFSNVNVTGCTVSGITGFASSNASGVGILLSGCNNSVGLNYIQSCHIHNIGASATGSGGNGGPAGLFPYQSDHVIAQFNIVHDIFGESSGSTTQDGIGLDIDKSNTNCQLLSNVAYNCQGPGITFFSDLTAGSTHVVANNVINNCCTVGYDGGHVYFTGTDTCKFFQNTVIANAPYPVVLVSSGAQANKTFLNNCLIAPSGVATMNLPTSLTGLVSDGNYQQSGAGAFLAIFNSTSYTSLSAWQTATSLETNGVAAGNCHFVQPQPPVALTPSTIAGAVVYSPITSNPLIGAGASLSAHSITPANDILGNSYTQCIGAIYAAGNPGPYAAAVLADSPIAWFRLGETAAVLGVSRFVDSISGYSAGTWTAPTLNQAVLAPGDGAPSVSCNGSSSEGITPIIATTPALSAITLEFWVEFSALSSANQTVISCSDAAHGGQASFDVFMDLTTMAFYTRDTSSHQSLGTLVFTFATGTVYHVVLTNTVAGNASTAYVNGSAVTVTPGTSTNTTTMVAPSIYVGGEVGQSRFLAGKISNVAIYSSILSSTRAAAHYTAGSTALSYTLSGSATAVVGTPDTLTVTPSGVVISDVVSMSSSGESGTLSTASLAFHASSVAQNLTWTPAAVGAADIAGGSAAGYTVNGSPFAITASSGGGSLVAGLASLTGLAATTASVTATAPTGGTPGYTYQWQQSTDGVTFVNASGTGVTTLTATVTGLTTLTLYYFRLVVTDSASNTADTNVIQGEPGATGGGIGSLTEQQLYFLRQRPRRIKDGPTVPGYRARRR